MAGWFVVVAAAMLLIQCFSGLAGLNSVETRDRVTEWLRTPAGNDLGWSHAQALNGLRLVLMVTGAAAAAGTILGWFSLQRHHGARWALIVVAAITLVGAVVLNDPLGAFVAGAAGLLWSGPARDWYAGRPIRQPAALLGKPLQDERPKPPSQPPVQPPNHSPGESPQPPPPWPTQPSSQAPNQPPATSNFGQPQPFQQALLPPVEQVPRQIVLVVRLTWVACVTAVAGIIGFMVWLADNSETFLDYIMKAPTTEMFPVERSQVLPQVWLMAVMVLGWAVAAAVLAFFVLRRHDWARILLLISAIPACLFSILALPYFVFQAAAAALTIGVLLGKPARAWFSGRPPVR